MSMEHTSDLQGKSFNVLLFEYVENVLFVGLVS